MADSRTLTKRFYKVAPNEFGVTYVARSIQYRPHYESWKGEVIDEGGYYLCFEGTTAKLEGNIRSEGPYYMGARPFRRQELVLPANRFNSNIANKIVNQYMSRSYVEEFCDSYGLVLVDDPDDAAINSPGFAWERRDSGYYYYANRDAKPKKYDLMYRNQTIPGLSETDLPRNMRRKLDVHEGAPVGNMTLIRTQDKKGLIEFREGMTVKEFFEKNKSRAQNSIFGFDLYSVHLDGKQVATNYDGVEKYKDYIVKDYHWDDMIEFWLMDIEIERPKQKSASKCTKPYSNPKATPKRTPAKKTASKAKKPAKRK